MCTMPTGGTEHMFDLVGGWGHAEHGPQPTVDEDVGTITDPTVADTPGGIHTQVVDIPQGELADVVKRLKRIEGQIGGIVRMIEDGRDCSAVVTQLAAASKALSKAGFAVVSTGMRYCSINEDGETREVDLRELERLFLSLA